MKKKILSILIVVFTFSSYAQYEFEKYPRACLGNIAGGFGLNYIDGEPFYTFHFAPEVSLANFGFGLDLRLDFDKNGNIRKQTYKEFSDYISIIRYVRYGLKNDPVFIKLGALDYYTLGHGSIIYNYNNSPSYDARRIGLVFDVDFGMFGLESIYGRFGDGGIIGARGYVRPFKIAGETEIPIISNMEVGISYAGDYSENAGIISGFYNPTTNKIIAATDVNSIKIIGFDLGFPIISNSLLNLELYLDYNKIINFGSGVATGVIFNFNTGLVSGTAKLERRINGEQYIPSYFNSLYEVEKFRIDSVNFVRTKAQRLASATTANNGYYGELGINVFGLFNVIGSYQRLDKTPESGIFHASAEVAPEDAPFMVRAGYDKINIKNESDLFTLDDRSYLFAELGYKPYPFMIVSLVYNWTFTPVRGEGNRIIDYEPIKRIEPRVSFVFPFSACGN